MNKIDRYLWRSVAQSTLLALLVLVSIYFLIEFIAELARVGKGSYTLLKVVEYSLLTAPRSVYEFFPTAVLVGGMMSLGQLAANSELVAIRSAGVSIARIVGAVLLLGLMLAIGAGAAGEWVVPASEQRADAMRDAALRSASDKSEQGGGHNADLWVRDGGSMVNVRRIYPGHKLGDIRIYDFDGRRLASVSRVEYAVLNDDGRWQLENVRRSVISDQGIAKQSLAVESRDHLVSPEFFRLASLDPEQMTAMSLFRHIRFLEQNNLDSSRHRLVFWTRFTIPLSCPVMLLIAAPFAFGPVRSGGAAQRLFIGALIGLALHLIGRIFNNLALVLKLWPLFGAVAPLLLFMLLGIVALRRAR
jgi:lipopolysaccharide export system permease protein